MEPIPPIEEQTAATIHNLQAQIGDYINHIDGMRLRDLNPMIAMLRENGYTFEQIATPLGVSPEAVQLSLALSKSEQPGGL